MNGLDLDETFDAREIFSSNNRAIATALALAGFYVFPCDQKKKPIVKWREESTHDVARIERWWDRNPDALVGINIGPAGLVVVDADRHGGPDGVAAIQEMIGGDLLALGCPIVETAGGGLHLFFRQPEGEKLGNSPGGLPPGVDVRGDGGYVIAPESIRLDGSLWRAMDDTPDLADAFNEAAIPPLPKAVLDVIKAGRKKDEADSAPGPPPKFESTAGERERAWAAKALEGVAADLAATGSGGRNNALNGAAYRMGRMVARNWISESAVRIALEDACRANGLWKSDGARGVRKSMESGLTAGKASPHEDLAGRENDDELVHMGGEVAAAFEREQEVVAHDEDGTAYDPQTGEVFEQAQEKEQGGGSDEGSCPASNELPDHLTRPDGVMGEIIDWIVDSAQRPNRVLALGSTIAAFGTIIGRRVAGPTQSGTHLYVVALARSASGKDHPLRRACDILRLVREALVGPGEFTSQNALAAHVEKHPLSMCAIDEFGSFARRICNPRASSWELGLTKLLREYWGASFETVPGMKGVNRDSEPVVWPALALFGTSTHQEFFDALSSKEATNGFLNRFLMISTEARVHLVEEPKASRHVIPQSIRNKVSEIWSYCVGDAALISEELRDITLLNEHGQIVIEWHDQSVRAKFMAFMREMIDRAEVAQIGELYGRTAEMAIRLATIHAVSRAGIGAKITHRDLDWGCELALWSAETMARETSMRMADTAAQANANLVLRAIHEAGGTIKHRDLHRKLNHRLKIQDMKDVLMALEESGTIRKVVTQPAKGGPKTITYTVSERKL